MKTSKKTPENQKKLYKSNPIHFQIGLILSLLIIYLVLQVALPALDTKPEKIASLPPEDVTYMPDNYTVEKDIKKEKKPQKKKPILLTDLIIDDEPAAAEPDTDFLTEPEPGEILNPGDVTYIKDTIPVEVDFRVVEFVPVFPGCETLATNEERKACMSEKIGRIIQKNFKTYLAERYGLSGVQKIYTQFKINVNGEVTDIKVRSPHALLEKEALRVLQLIPQMKPGKQRDRNVAVIFSKPIIFRVE